MLNFWYLIERSKQGLAVGSNQDIKQKFGPVSYFLNYSLYSEGCAGYQTVLVNPLHQFAEVSLGEPVHVFSMMTNDRLVLNYVNQSDLIILTWDQPSYKQHFLSNDLVEEAEQ